MPHTFKRDMTITHADFLRILPKALGSTDYKMNGNSVSFNNSDVNICITLSPEQNWSIGALSLPRTHVEISLEGCDEDVAKQYISRFDRSYQKGGG